MPGTPAQSHTHPHICRLPHQRPAAEDSTASRMATVMREQYAAKGYCDVHDLARAGFPEAQIIENMDTALRLAGPARDLTRAVA